MVFIRAVNIKKFQTCHTIRVKLSPPEITYKKTGQKILFFGLDDPAKVKSIKLPFGYVGIVWFEELDQFSGMEEIRNVLQSLLRGGPSYQVFGTYNPPKSRNNWVNEEILVDDPDRLVHHSTYLTVPKDWLGPQFLAEAEKLKSKNEMSYRHEYLGEVTGTGGAVFENVEDLAMSSEQLRPYGDKVTQAEFLLFNLGWDKRWGTEAYFGDYPCVDDEVLELIIDGGYKGIGFDVIGLDPIADENLTRHKKLFRACDIVNIENLKDLDCCGDDLFWFSCAPLKIEDCDGSPIRAIAWFED